MGAPLTPEVLRDRSGGGYRWVLHDAAGQIVARSHRTYKALHSARSAARRAVARNGAPPSKPGARSPWRLIIGSFRTPAP